jgi:hypothetical protein
MRSQASFPQETGSAARIANFLVDMQNFYCYIVVKRLAIAVLKQRNGQPEPVLKEDLSEADSKDVADFD